MSELSPAAQAVIDAYANAIKANPHGRWCENAIAAALRAAAWQLREAYENEECTPSPDDWLEDLANELEKQ